MSARTFIAAVAALSVLYASAGHAENLCVGPNGTEIPCAELGAEYICDSSDVDTVSLKKTHLLSDLVAHTITIQSFLKTARKGKRYPVVRYDMQTGKLTLNGQRCRRVCSASREECE